MSTRPGFLEGVAADPQTCDDWNGGGWNIETDGRDDDMFSPFLRKPFAPAVADGVIPPSRRWRARWVPSTTQELT